MGSNLPEKLVGPPGLEPGTNGFTIPDRIDRFWETRLFSIGVDYLTAPKGAGRSCLLLRTLDDTNDLQSSGSLCTFRRCTPGLAQDCRVGQNRFRFP